MNISQFVKDELPDGWQDEFGGRRFAYLAGATEYIEENFGQKASASGFRGFFGKTPDMPQPASAPSRYENAGFISFYPGLLNAISAGPTRKDVDGYGHLSFSIQTLAELTQDHPKPSNVGAVLLAAMTIVEGSEYWEDTATKPPELEMRLAIYEVENLPFSNYEDFCAHEHFQRIMRLSGQNVKEFWEDVIAGFPVTRMTAQNIASAIKTVTGDEAVVEQKKKRTDIAARRGADPGELKETMRCARYELISLRGPDLGSGDDAEV